MRINEFEKTKSNPPVLLVLGFKAEIICCDANSSVNFRIVGVNFFNFKRFDPGSFSLDIAINTHTKRNSKERHDGGQNDDQH